jgi:pimeloyl-ACP methyl ester carboxylesterase
MFQFILVAFACVAASFTLALGFTAWKAHEIEQQFPNHGELLDVGGFRMNSLLIRAATPDLPPIVFIHGASGNLRDQETAFRSRLEGRADLLFVDRPGHGYSERGGHNNNFPEGQASAIAKLMEVRGIEKAIIVGHSFGGAIAASFAVYHPDKTAGLVFLSPATHPWPGGVDWHYNVSSSPYTGWLFTRLVALPAGMVLLDKATHSVFSPNPRPTKYVVEGAPALVLRPANFRNNAKDVANLNDYVRRVAPLYRQITAPTVIITGDSDDIVAEEIHSRGLERDIAGSELVWIRGLGHKPDYIVPELAIAAMEKVAGFDRDLQAMARAAEERLRHP